MFCDSCSMTADLLNRATYEDPCPCWQESLTSAHACVLCVRHTAIFLSPLIILFLIFTIMETISFVSSRLNPALLVMIAADEARIRHAYSCHIRTYTTEQCPACLVKRPSHTMSLVHFFYPSLIVLLETCNRGL